MSDKSTPGEAERPGEREQEEKKLLHSIAGNLETLQELVQRCSDHWGYEDPIYRFYHQSFKVFHLQGTTQEIVEKLQSLAPHVHLNPWFMEIVRAGTGKDFSPDANAQWLTATRLIVEAFFHARYFLEMICKYGKELESPPQMLPSGWAAVLYLYNLR